VMKMLMVLVRLAHIIGLKADKSNLYAFKTINTIYGSLSR